MYNIHRLDNFVKQSLLEVQISECVRALGYAPVLMNIANIRGWIAINGQLFKKNAKQGCSIVR